jgi:hypothetical protein
VPRIEAATFPRIDQINIQSTGDIHTTAQNHQQLKAKRFEILVGVDDFEHRNNEKILPGDIPGDDGTLHGGDVHIRAGNRIVIKAEDSIVLQVGRTSVEINDDGFSVRSRVTSTTLPNVYDAVLALSPRDGISITGQKVEITGQRSLSIGDGFGGSLETELGVMGIKAREVSIEDFDTVAYIFMTIANSVKYVQSMMSSSMALGLLAHKDDEDKKLRKQRENDFAKAWGHVEYWTGKAAEIAGFVEECIGLKDADKDWKAFNAGEVDVTTVSNNAERIKRKDSFKLAGRTEFDKKTNNGAEATGAITTKGVMKPETPTSEDNLSIKSFCETLVSFLDCVLEMTGKVYAMVETIYRGLERADEKKEIAGTHWKDKLNHAALVIDNTIIEVAVVILTGLSGMTASKIELKANGQIVINADTIQHVYDTEFSQCATPSEAIETASRVPGVLTTIGKGAGILIDIANYSVQTYYDNQEDEEEEEL